MDVKASMDDGGLLMFALSLSLSIIQKASNSGIDSVIVRLGPADAAADGRPRMNSSGATSWHRLGRWVLEEFGNSSVQHVYFSFPDAPCMEYSPTLTPESTPMYVNMSYMECLGW